jgi:hypothetical protein
VGIEFGVWMTVDGGTNWVQLKGGIPTTQARDLHTQRREGDLVVGTFGRGAYILDDYSPLRALTPQSLAEEAHLYPLRDAYMFDLLTHEQAAWGNAATPNPPYGALFTYSIGRSIDNGTKLVLTITDSDGKQIRRLHLPSEAGVSRVAWDLRAEPPSRRETTDAASGRGGSSAAAGAADDQEPPAIGFGGGRGGPPQGPPVPAGRYRAAIGKLDGDKFTPIGESQAFQVVPLMR